MKIANPWKRLGAYIIDAFIIGIPSGIIWLTVAFSFLIVNWQQFQDAVQSPDGKPSPELTTDIYLILAAFLLIRVIAFWLYNALLESSAWQATVGKKTFGIKVQDKNKRKISFGRATGRTAVKYLTLIFWPAFIVLCFLKDHQALHDLPVDTYVVDA